MHFNSRTKYKGSLSDEKIKWPLNYEWEAHIFFDDGFKKTPNSCTREEVVFNELNYFVNCFISIMGKLITGYGKSDVDPYPIAFLTPYGAKLVWNLPGNTTLTCHVKDKTQIRCKKRWSQCMYLHYLLDYRIQRDKNELTTKRMQFNEDNTFILTVDGDMQFHPNAIIMLVDVLLDRPDVGAVCGTTLPAGSGVLEIFQRYEYGFQHCLSKTTEGALGSIFCVPGCFSVLRGKALLNANILKKFASEAVKPAHFLKYDQGEDRWMTTLLLKEGWRAEYFSLCTVYTTCPDTIEDFYKQRRRWNNSIVANMLELIGNWRIISSKNKKLSILLPLYICCQLVLLVFTPGNVFLGICGTFSYFLHLPRWISMLIHLTPIALYILVCLTMKQKCQLRFAKIITVLYISLQLANVVFMINDAITYGLEGLFTLFVFMTFGVILLAVLFNPEHISCLTGGLFYFAAIPSFSVYLNIYTICNLTDVTWGTRETHDNDDAKINDNEMQHQTTADEQRIEDDVQELDGNVSGSNVNGGTSVIQGRQLNELSTNENLFWDRCISNYLKPIIGICHIIFFMIFAL